MSIVAWVLLGIVAGVMANQLRARRGIGLTSDALLGIAGASVAGFVFSMVADRRLGDMGLWDLFVPLFGATLVLVVASASAGPHQAAAAGRTQRTKRIPRSRRA